MSDSVINEMYIDDNGLEEEGPEEEIMINKIQMEKEAQIQIQMEKEAQIQIQIEKKARKDELKKLMNEAAEIKKIGKSENH